MASSEEEQKFPPQSQDRQPGEEHVMDPTPQAINPDHKPSNKLHGKVAVVTGGDSGIGRAVCYAFALEGATVAFTYVADREEKDAEDTLRMIKDVKASDAKDPMAMAADLGYDENCKMVVDEVIDEFGRIDILVNNAAEQHLTNTVEEITEERLDRVFRTNIFSQFFMTRHSLRHMKPGSCIINTTSVNAYNGNPTVLDYTAMKGAIVSFTRGLTLQLIERGTRVNAVAPGPVWTPLQPASMPEDKVAKLVAPGPVWTPLQQASMPEDKVAKLGSETPMNRAAQPHEIAPAYVFLACNHCSSYFTGQVLHPNGGMIVNA